MALDEDSSRMIGMAMSSITQSVADALCSYYAWWQSTYHEDVYAVALYSTALVDYLGCTVLTRQGLDAAVAKYLSMEQFKGTPVDELRRDLEWSPCDSPHHMENTEIFDALNSEVSGWSDEFCEMEEPEFFRAVNAAYAWLLDGIREFRRTAIPTESRIVTTMFWGDMSDEDLFAFTRYCCPPDVAESFVADWDKG